MAAQALAAGDPDPVAGKRAAVLNDEHLDVMETIDIGTEILAHVDEDQEMRRLQAQLTAAKAKVKALTEQSTKDQALVVYDADAAEQQELLKRPEVQCVHKTTRNARRASKEHARVADERVAAAAAEAEAAALRGEVAAAAARASAAKEAAQDALQAQAEVAWLASEEAARAREVAAAELKTERDTSRSLEEKMAGLMVQHNQSKESKALAAGGGAKFVGTLRSLNAKRGYGCIECKVGNRVRFNVKFSRRTT